MKSKIWLIQILVAVTLWVGALPAFAQIDQESILLYDAQITVQRDATILVQESIVYDFGQTERHGIYRDIPVRYKARGGNYNLRMSDITVKDETGMAYQFQISDEGSNKRIKIGNPSETITGTKTYVINYSVKRAINYFDNLDELYWNVTGNDWHVPINSASATVRIPADTSTLQTECYRGLFGSTVPCTTKNMESNNVVSFSSEGLASQEGLTIVVGMPKGVVLQPSMVSRLRDILIDNWVLGFPVLTFVGMIYVWRRFGRDPQGKGTIIAQYDVPDNLSPAEVGTVVDEKVNDRDISAELIALAIQGYVRINRLEKKILFFNTTDYELELLKAGDKLTKDHQRNLLEKMFAHGTAKTEKKGVLKAVKISDLKNTFYKDLPGITETIYNTLTESGFFDKNPKQAGVIYFVIGIVLIVLGGILTGIMGGFALLGFGSSGLIVIIFGLFMGRKSAKGVLVKEHIEGLKLYLNVAEKDRINFHNAPEKSPEMFEKMLPYAMVLRVEQAWAKQFEDIYKNPPSWYHDPTGHAFSAVYFTDSLHDFSSSAYSSMSSQPSSASGGGSGFSGGGSGGGFGGGGGGSW